MHARCPRLRKEYLSYVSMASDIKSSRSAALKLSERCKLGMGVPLDALACAMYYGDANVRRHLLRYVSREACIEGLRLLSLVG